jgi:hypothetical protein
MSDLITHVSFDTIKIPYILLNNQPHVSLRPIAEALSLNWKSQSEKLGNDTVLNSVVVQSASTGADGKQYKMLMLPLKYLNGWLFKVNPDRVKPEARDKVIAYQRNCYDALYAHFFNATPSGVRLPNDDFTSMGTSTLEEGEETGGLLPAGSSFLAPTEQDKFDQRSFSLKLQAVNAASRVYGQNAARKMWVQLGLPEMPIDATSPASPRALARLHKLSPLPENDLSPAQRDANECLSHLLASTALLNDSIPLCVYLIDLMNSRGDEDFDYQGVIDIVKRAGIQVDYEQNCLKVANKSKWLDSLYAGTRFAGKYTLFLHNLKGVRWGGNLYVDGAAVACKSIPMSYAYVAAKAYDNLRRASL